MTSKKLLKVINMYEINESGCQVLHVELQKIYYFFGWILLPPKFKQNSLVPSWLCRTLPRKGIFSSKGDWDVTDMDITYFSLSHASFLLSCATRVACGQQLKEGQK